MPERRRSVGALALALIAMGLAGCGSGEPPPSCGELTLDTGEDIPQEAVDCMSEGGQDRALRVTVPTVEGDHIVMVYSANEDGSIVVTTDRLEDNQRAAILLCRDAVSVVDLGDCEELHQGD